MSTTTYSNCLYCDTYDMLCPDCDSCACCCSCAECPGCGETPTDLGMFDLCGYCGQCDNCCTCADNEEIADKLPLYQNEQKNFLL